MPSIKEMLDTPVGPRGERAAAFLFKASQVFFVAAVGFALAAWTFKPTEAAAATYYPDENPETSSVDGYAAESTGGVSWATLIGGAGNTASSTSSTAIQAIISGGSSNTWGTLYRSVLAFDTSSPLSATEAQLCVTIERLNDPQSWNPSYSWYAVGLASQTDVVAGDFNGYTGSALTESRSYSSFTDETLECWDLNASGISYLATTSTPSFMLRNSYDVSGSPPTWSASVTQEIRFDNMETASAGSEPYLIVDPDPRPNPVVTINEPDDDEAYAGFPPTYQVVSNVCANDYPGETDIVWDFDIEKWDGDSWEDYASASFIRDGFLVANGCSSGLAYAAGGIPDPPFPVSFTGGSYRVAARVTFDGYSPGSYSAFNEFTVSNIPYGGGGGGSWSAGDGGGDEWNTVLDNAPTAPTCDFWGSSAGAGLECLWTWTRYIVIPPDDYFFDIISKPIDTLATRWPFVYLTDTIVAVTSGWSATETCPLPTVGGGTALGSTVPSADLCDWFDTGDVVEANPAAEAIIVTIIWLGFSLAVFYRARSFLMS